MAADSLALHLTIPEYLDFNHLWSFNVGYYVWAVMPMNGDWLFGLAFLLAGEYGAKLLNFGMALLNGWLLWLCW